MKRLNTLCLVSIVFLLNVGMSIAFIPPDPTIAPCSITVPDQYWTVKDGGCSDLSANDGNCLEIQVKINGGYVEFDFNDIDNVYRLFIDWSCSASGTQEIYYVREGSDTWLFDVEEGDDSHSISPQRDNVECLRLYFDCPVGSKVYIDYIMLQYEA